MSEDDTEYFSIENFVVYDKNGEVRLRFNFNNSNSHNSINKNIIITIYFFLLLLTYLDCRFLGRI
jgi:hypothetical protein